MLTQKAMICFLTPDMSELRGKIHGPGIFTFLLKAYSSFFLSFDFVGFSKEANCSIIQNHAYEMQNLFDMHIPCLWFVGHVTNAGGKR